MRAYTEIIEERENITTLSQVINRYKLEILPDKSENTIYNETLILERLRTVFGNMRPKDIAPSRIYEYMDKRSAKNGKSQANNEKVVLSNLMNCAIKWGMIDRNPCKEVKRNSVKIRDRYLTDQEFELLRSKASKSMQVLMDFAYVTALRISDILNIRLGDIQGNVLHVTTQKTGKKQTFDITDDLVEVIARAKALRRPVLSTYLFSSKKGTRVNRNTFNSNWDDLKKRCELSEANIHFHDIRAKSLTDAHRQGFNAQLMAGHQTRTMTDRYIKRRPNDIIKPLPKVKK
jgi:integrase